MTSFDLFDDQRSHLPKGVLRSFRLPKVTLPGGGYISKGDDGRIAVAGRECASKWPLVIICSDTFQHWGYCVSPVRRPSQSLSRRREIYGMEVDLRLTVSVQMLPGLMEVCLSFLVLIPYSSVPVFNNKILTSARNGELIMWDIAKDSRSKFGEFPLNDMVCSV